MCSWPSALLASWCMKHGYFQLEQKGGHLLGLTRPINLILPVGWRHLQLNPMEYPTDLDNDVIARAVLNSVMLGRRLLTEELQSNGRGPAAI